jgi:hypothetical protein
MQERLMFFNSYTLYADLFEIAAGLVSEHDAEFMDTL